MFEESNNSISHSGIIFIKKTSYLSNPKLKELSLQLLGNNF
jgi:hypothetical protein